MLFVIMSSAVRMSGANARVQAYRQMWKLVNPIQGEPLTNAVSVS